MSMESMPDDCLLQIFNMIDDPLILFRCLRVCRRWYLLLSYRLGRVENLLDLYHIKCKPGVKSLCFVGKKRPLEEPILSAILKKTPKMKVVCVGFEYTEYDNYDVNWVQRSLDRLAQLESLKGLIITYLTRVRTVKIPENIEMLRTDDTYITTGFYPRVKQLLVDDTFFTRSINRFPSLERLNLLIDNHPSHWYQVARAYRYLFRKLKIIEIDTSYEECLSEVNHACQFICLCPKAESAHIKIAIDQTVHFTHFRHENLKNLVITYVDYELMGEYISNLFYLLKRFPNVKHLAIKYDTNFEAVVEIVPVLLDMRDITGVDATSAMYVHDYCQQKGRSIKFYFGYSDDSVVKRDWPELFNDNERDGQEFNFMKHLFLPDYRRTPFFLEPY
uniref:F-box domain-containing protein n=1 Tax=Tetranychus urticae TaxID=32264 RepID=T1KZB1_TETUR